MSQVCGNEPVTETDIIINSNKTQMLCLLPPQGTPYLPEPRPPPADQGMLGAPSSQPPYSLWPNETNCGSGMFSGPLRRVSICRLCAQQVFPGAADSAQVTQPPSLRTVHPGREPLAEAVRGALVPPCVGPRPVAEVLCE